MVDAGQSRQDSPGNELESKLPKWLQVWLMSTEKIDGLILCVFLGKSLYIFYNFDGIMLRNLQGKTLLRIMMISTEGHA